MDIRSSTAGQLYARASQATEAKTPGESAQQALQSFSETLQRGEATAQASMTGGADPQALVQALAQTELAVETAVTVRDKVVEAYQEILRMPV